VAENVGDFCELLSQHRDWFLQDANGNILSNDDGYKLMDPGNYEWRAYWLDRVRISQETLHWQGVFLDNVEASLEKRSRYGNIPAAYPEDASYQAAIEDNLRYLYTTYFQPQGRLLYANIISLQDAAVWFRYLQYLDGAMMEDFAVDWNDAYKRSYEWEAQMDIVEKTQALGKGIILVSQGSEFDHQRELFAFASYLLVNHGTAYFRYTNASSYDENWIYENYSDQLGPALGSRYRIDDVWVRDFTNGSVWVNLSTNTGGINLTN
jgi:hypothetical protein